MALSTSNVGRTWGPVTATADARWTMAYAAGLGDTDPRYYATDLGAVPAHPLFSVSAEWSLLIDEIAGSGAWSREDALRGVHATHDVVLHSPLRSGTPFSLTASVVGLELRKPGAYQVVRHDAVTEDGQPLWSSWTGSLFRGVDIEGDPVTPDVPEAPVLAASEPLQVLELPIGLLDAHVYTECARIWNPIHTDTAVARQAGLDVPILHGTATVAKAVSLVLQTAGARPEQVRRVRCRFASPALLGTALNVNVLPEQDGWWPFEVLDTAGSFVVRDAALQLHP